MEENKGKKKVEKKEVPKNTINIQEDKKQNKNKQAIRNSISFKENKLLLLSSINEEKVKK